MADQPPHPNPGGASEQSAAKSAAPHRICRLNIGNGQPVRLLDFIEALEEAIGKPASGGCCRCRQATCCATWADSEPLHTLTGLRPATPLKQGVTEFCALAYLGYYRPAP